MLRTTGPRFTVTKISSTDLREFCLNNSFTNWSTRPFNLHPLVLLRNYRAFRLWIFDASVPHSTKLTTARFWCEVKFHMNCEHVETANFLCGLSWLCHCLYQSIVNAGSIIYTSRQKRAHGTFGETRWREDKNKMPAMNINGLKYVQAFSSGKTLSHTSDGKWQTKRFVYYRSQNKFPWPNWVRTMENKLLFGHIYFAGTCG